MLYVREAEYLHDYVIWIKFNDGEEGVVNLEKELGGEVFGPLKDLIKFRSFQVDPILETIVWENGADLAPEFLRDILVTDPEEVEDHFDIQSSLGAKGSPKEEIPFDEVIRESQEKYEKN